MSYLNVPRIHFFGEFLASPSTINNRASNFDPVTNPIPEYPPTVQANPNGLVGWNPMGVARFMLNGTNINGTPLSGVFVKSVMPETGDLVLDGDPIIGARILTSTSGAPGKIVDLDPGQQMISQLFGLQLQLNIPSEDNAGFSMKGGEYLAVPNLTDMNGSRFSGIMETKIFPEQINWNNTSSSTLLGKFEKACKYGISVKFTLDLFQGFDGNTSAPNFTFGRITGALGPALEGEPTRCSVGRKFIPQTRSGGEGSSALYQSGYLLVDNTRNKSVIDLSNSTLMYNPKTNAPFPKELYAAVIIKDKPNYFGNKKNVVDNYSWAYINTAGIVEVDINKTETKGLVSNPFALYDPASRNPDVAVLQEADTYVNLSKYFMRLPASNDGNESSLSVDMIARQWGKPLADTYAIEFVSNSPQTGISIPKTVTTGADGKGTLTVTWDGLKESNLQGDRSYIGSQLYYLGGDWQKTSNMFWSGAGLSVIAWPAYKMPANPTWLNDVKPVMDEFMRVYPGMKQIMDMSDYDTVKNNSQKLKMVFSFPETNPSAMPVTRDLSPALKSMIILWIDQGCIMG